MPLQRTPFYQFHVDHGAKFVDFAGWEMPLSYGSIIDEHKQVRERGGLFDVSHMGRLKISGRHARRLVEKLVTRRVSDMPPLSCRYALVCNEQGGVMDDVLVYRFEDHWLLVVNASNRVKIFQHIQKLAGDMVVKMEDTTLDTGMVALQGPGVMEAVGQFSREVPTLKRYGFCIKNLLIMKMIISRTGYTGEDGIEVILGSKMATMAVKMLIKDRGDSGGGAMKPAGLGARDTLRLEAGMPLYGHELDETIDPLTAGLAWAVNMEKDQDENGEVFVGQEALKRIAATGLQRQRIGLRLEGKRTPRQGAKVMRGDKAIGIVTSGCLSPTLGYPIAMAYIGADAAGMGDAVTVEISEQGHEAQIVPLPFYKRG